MSAAEMSETQAQIERSVKRIAGYIEEGMTYAEADMDHEENGCQPDDMISGFDYLADCLDITYICNSDGSYKAAEVVVGYGGPNIWIDTRAEKVCAAWWLDYAEYPYFSDAMGLNDTLEEMWDCK